MLVAEDGTPLTAGTEGGKVVGVISLRDIISAIRE
jgi:CBS domain-containing protein